jgi:hypothetical protein
VFYEHNQFPEKYHDAYLVCDYRWKKESNDQYATTGRLVAFFLNARARAGRRRWKTLARPKQGARDADGKPINFALVDVAVAPDGSLFVTDHNQGIWRIFYANTHSTAPIVPPRLSRVWQSTRPQGRLDELLSLPQPDSEWSRQRVLVIRNTKEVNIQAGLTKTPSITGALCPNACALCACCPRTLRNWTTPHHGNREEFERRDSRAQAAWLTESAGEKTNCRCCLADV